MERAAEPSAEEQLYYAKELFKQFRKQTPSAPDWYHLADYCIGVLMAEHVERLERKVHPLSHEE